MEKIQKALDKARQQREWVGREQAQKPADWRPGVVDASEVTAGGVRATGEAEQGGAISVTYNRTRVVRATRGNPKNRLLVAGLPNDGLADVFRILRTQVVQRLSGKQLNTLAVTSPNPGEGKSFTAANLAVSLAQSLSQTVLLVDLDLRRPSIHKFFGIRPELGLNDYLLRNVPLSECLINPGIERLVILPVSGSLKNSSEMLSSPRMVRLTDELSTRYPDRLVLYDLPPVLTTDDTLVFLQFVGACLLVVQDGTTKEADVERSAELLAERNLIGTVLNNSSVTSSRYY